MHISSISKYSYGQVSVLRFIYAAILPENETRPYCKTSSFIFLSVDKVILPIYVKRPVDYLLA